MPGHLEPVGWGHTYRQRNGSKSMRDRTEIQVEIGRKLLTLRRRRKEWVKYKEYRFLEIAAMSKEPLDRSDSLAFWRSRCFVNKDTFLFNSFYLSKFHVLILCS